MIIILTSETKFDVSINKATWGRRCMSFTFDLKKAVNVILFILRSIGNSCDPFSLFALLYIAELKHLAKYGSPITGDSYIAMKNGAIPFTIYTIYQQLSNKNFIKRIPGHILESMAIDKSKIIAITDYNEELISRSEVECLFDVIREYKNESPGQLRSITMNYAWEQARETNTISFVDMAIASGATDEMLLYITNAFENEMILFEENNAPGS